VSSSGVSRVETVLVRKPALLSSLDEDLFACTVVVWEAFKGDLPSDMRDLSYRA